MALPLYGGGFLPSIFGTKKKRDEDVVQEAVPAAAPTPTPTVPEAPKPPSKAPWASLMNNPVPTQPPRLSGLGVFGNMANPTANPPKPAEPTPTPPMTWKNAGDTLSAPLQGNVLQRAPGPAMGESFTPAANSAGPMIRPNATPGPERVDVTPPAVPPESLKNFQAGPLTEQGKLYEDYVLGGLKSGKFGELDAARGAYDRDSALRTTQATESAKQAALRAGAAPGSSLWQSIMNQSMGGANRANLEQNNDVNALGRDLIQKALDRAQGIETQTYNRADAERALRYSRADLDFERKRAAEAVAKGDQGAFLNSIEDNAVRSWAASQFAQGKSLQEVSAGIWSTDPATGRTVYRPEIASLSPGKQNAKNILDHLTALGMSEADAQKVAVDLAKNQVRPAQEGAEKATYDAIATKAKNTGITSLTPEEKATFTAGMPTLRGGDIPLQAQDQWIRDTPFVKINGQILQPKRLMTQTLNVPGFPNSISWIEATDETGKTVWIRASGQLARTMPNDLRKYEDYKAWVDSLEKF